MIDEHVIFNTVNLHMVNNHFTILLTVHLQSI